MPELPISVLDSLDTRYAELRCVTNAALIEVREHLEETVSDLQASHACCARLDGCREFSEVEFIAEGVRCCFCLRCLSRQPPAQKWHFLCPHEACKAKMHRAAAGSGLSEVPEFIEELKDTTRDLLALQASLAAIPDRITEVLAKYGSNVRAAKEKVDWIMRKRSGDGDLTPPPVAKRTINAPLAIPDHPPVAASPMPAPGPNEEFDVESLLDYGHAEDKNLRTP